MKLPEFLDIQHLKVVRLSALHNKNSNDPHWESNRRPLDSQRFASNICIKNSLIFLVSRRHQTNTHANGFNKFREGLFIEK